MTIQEMFVATTQELKDRQSYLEKLLKNPNIKKSLYAISTEIVTLKMFLETKEEPRKSQ
jgi:hypothetical protein